MNEDVHERQKTAEPLDPPDSEFPDWEDQPENPRHKASLHRHDRKCAICNHPERDEIEAAFLDWGRPAQLTRQFKLGHRTVVYRHAHALGLFKKRAQNAKFALGLLLEQSSVIKPTANQIINAVRAYACLNEHGKWTDPPRRLIVTHLDGKGDEIPADQVDPAWRLGRSKHPSPNTEEAVATKEALAAPRPPTKPRPPRRQKGDPKDEKS